MQTLTFDPFIFPELLDIENPDTFWTLPCNQISGIKDFIQTEVLIRWCHTSTTWWAWDNLDNVWKQHHEHTIRQWIYHLISEGRIRYNVTNKGGFVVSLAIDSTSGVSSLDKVLRDIYATDMVKNTNLTDPIWVGFSDGDVSFVRGVPQRASMISPYNYITSRLPIPIPTWLNTPIVRYADDVNRPHKACQVIDDICRVEGDPIRSEAQSRLIWTFYGASMLDGNNALERMLTLIGPKGTGKSVILGFPEKWTLSEYIASVQPSELGERFGTSSLVGKRINIVDDIEETEVTKTGKIKSIAQGKAVGVEYKGGKHTMVKFDRLVHMYASNEKGIRTPGANAAIYDRFVYVKCENSFRGTEKADPQVVDKVWNSEKNLIYEFAIATYLTVVKERWLQKDLDDSSNLEVAKMMEHYDRFGAWANQTLEPSDNPNDFVFIDNLAGSYASYKMRLGYKDRVTTPEQVFEALPKHMRDCLDRKQKRVGADRSWRKILKGYKFVDIDFDNIYVDEDLTLTLNATQNL